MAEHTFPCWAVFQILENRFALAEVLGFPEAARLGMNKTRLAEHLRRNLRPLIEALPLSELYRRQMGGVPSASSVSLSLEPPQGSDPLARSPLAYLSRSPLEPCKRSRGGVDPGAWRASFLEVAIPNN